MLNVIVPVAVIGAKDPVGKLTMDVYDVSIWVNIVESTVIWFVALLFRIQGLVKT